jgi:acyl-CoA synthetase (AMP-forming)/AMP-acid ligase II
MQATPVTWRQLIDAGWQGCSGFRALCGGESLPRDLADTLLKRVHELWNLYGPTETTIWSTIERVTPGSEPVAIGKPIANTQVYIVGPTGEPLGIGMPGEIWIGGAGVAAGYHARPELTAERFVPDRFSSNSEGRLYRTGDLGKWESNSQLYHLGRIDHQVKLRGVRIELGEIEAVLRRHPAVRDAVVVARQARAQSGDLSLVAYVVYQLGEELTATEVRRYLRRYLPDTMVPSVVVALDEIPVTPNGKTDHKALPDPFKNVSRSAKYEKPTPGSEAKLADIWQRLLKVDRVGAGDNFFELGGHSLLAIGVAAAVEKETGWRMDPRAMFFQDLREIALAMTRAVSRPVEAE